MEEMLALLKSAETSLADAEAKLLKIDLSGLEEMSAKHAEIQVKLQANKAHLRGIKSRLFNGLGAMVNETKVKGICRGDDVSLKRGAKVCISGVRKGDFHHFKGAGHITLGLQLYSVCEDMIDYLRQQLTEPQNLDREIGLAESLVAKVKDFAKAL